MDTRGDLQGSGASAGEDDGGDEEACAEDSSEEDGGGPDEYEQDDFLVGEDEESGGGDDGAGGAPGAGGKRKKRKRRKSAREYPVDEEDYDLLEDNQVMARRPVQHSKRLKRRGDEPWRVMGAQQLKESLFGAGGLSPTLARNHRPHLRTSQDLHDLVGSHCALAASHGGADAGGDKGGDETGEEGLEEGDEEDEEAAADAREGRAALARERQQQRRLLDAADPEYAAAHHLSAEDEVGARRAPAWGFGFVGQKLGLWESVKSGLEPMGVMRCVVLGRRAAAGLVPQGGC
ncbi:hypothetical protein MNEG_10318 [Monoraphidium neglectum]|uniref:Spt6 acidic N-terminal domain-containing protein n=1 Tax=Monoraphidium neglectum TaxID=145388 RepID=A0A0D2MT86_9CHLO|nr:hypothetical protein MNEG_10318 [Monoraphidium neglectum]KIY97645.1 hypothetical protein MNEG_10318 [Monoraphidium neglectum]|eukprot:XP_013896665.1 hypothetical protein MNEG_10318 [Monoraphidium neglectum]